MSKSTVQKILTYMDFDIYGDLEIMKFTPPDDIYGDSGGQKMQRVLPLQIRRRRPKNPNILTYMEIFQNSGKTPRFDLYGF